MTITKWQKLKGFEDRYLISSTGRLVTLCQKKKERSLKPGSGGYVHVDLYSHKGAEAHYTRMHVLVAKQFIEQPEGKNVVNHLDNHRDNNDVTNLEWGTHDDNSKHMVAQGRAFNLKQYVPLVIHLRFLGYSVVAISKELGLGRRTLTGWKKQGLFN